MKNLIKALVLLSMLSLFSCSKVIYTHEQVLDSYQTKQAVTKAFGKPTEKRLADSLEQWLYRFDTFRTRPVDVSQNVQTAAVTDFSRYNRYLIFTFDRGGNVIRSDFKGVDLTVKKSDPVATIVLIAAGTAIIIGATAYVSNHLFDNMTL
ncbi:MAG: hypothetical protein ACXVB0_09100 [Mucilaginibacter sp.]